MLLNQKITFSGVKGIDNLELTLSDKKMNILIGSNGVGKTKALESLYAILLFTNKRIFDNYSAYRDYFVFTKCEINDTTTIYKNYVPIPDVINTTDLHPMPVIYLAAQNRGEIKQIENTGIRPLGEYEERQKHYFQHILKSMKNHFSTLNMDTPIEEWFIQRAMSANSYQAEEDNREVELLAVLRILNQIDSRISADKKDFKIIGGKRVSIVLDGQERRLNELSSGFASLIKIVQSIVAGYSFFSNTNNIEQMAGYVLIDEIESHLHIEWQTKIIPLLTKIFPNTHFVITTHSSLVLAQLKDGHAYQLIKNKDKVTTKKIENPNQKAFIDLLQDAFNINLNTLKIQNTTPNSQLKTKQDLLELLGGA